MHNFTIYLGTGGNAYVYSRLISTVTTRQYCAPGRERGAGCVKEVTQKQ